MKIAVLTSGGDSPGMNACIRAIVRSAAYLDHQVVGVMRGYEGLIDGDFKELKVQDVANIIQRGGTILKTARSPRFLKKEFRQIAYNNLKHNNIDALIAIGGDGTFAGAKVFLSEFEFQIVGLPGTIDNDLYGTDFTIGYDSAINTVVQAVDKIRDTAMSHDRIFIVEVMGKDAGFIALRSGIAAGAEAILVPETTTYIDHLLEKLESRRKDKSSAIILVAEGDDFGGGQKVGEAIQSAYPEFDVKVSVLGHIQRGGSPSAMDRVLASQLGVGAVRAIVDGKSNIMVGRENKKLVEVDFEKAIKHHQHISQPLLDLAEMLSI
jgi:6-phosphofructokinase 1